MHGELGNFWDKMSLRPKHSWWNNIEVDLKDVRLFVRGNTF